MLKSCLSHDLHRASWCAHFGESSVSFRSWEAAWAHSSCALWLGLTCFGSKAKKTGDCYTFRKRLELMIPMSNLEYLKRTDQDSPEAAGEGLGDLALEHVTMWICCFGTEAVHCAFPGRHRERLRCGSATKKPSASHQFRRFRRHVQSCSVMFNIFQHISTSRNGAPVLRMYSFSADPTARSGRVSECTLQMCFPRNSMHGSSTAIDAVELRFPVYHRMPICECRWTWSELLEPEARRRLYLWRYCSSGPRSVDSSWLVSLVQQDISWQLRLLLCGSAKRHWKSLESNCIPPSHDITQSVTWGE